MKKHYLLALQLGILGILIVWHNILGVEAGFYWSIFWWDIPAHIFGGMWVALWFAWIFTYFDRRISIRLCVIAALIVGVGWEIFEYIAGLQDSVFMTASLDIVKDLFDDALGGFIAGYFATVRRVKLRFL